MLVAATAAALTLALTSAPLGLALVAAGVDEPSAACAPAATAPPAKSADMATNKATAAGRYYTQAQMQAAVERAGSRYARELGAIAMAESGGDRQSWPATNSTGTYDGPWMFQRAWTVPAGLDIARLDSDLDYAASEAAKLASTGLTTSKWQTWPTQAQPFLAKAPPLDTGGGKPAATPTQSASTAGCVPQGASGGAVVSADGWTFPLKTTQAVLKAGGWCWQSQVNCHGVRTDSSGNSTIYNAADLMAPTGTPVLAPLPGVVLSTHRGLGDACVFNNRGDTVSYRVDSGPNNGKAVFMGHFLTNSLTVKPGDHITAGQQIAVVGTKATAQCTVSHLHVQLNVSEPGGWQDSIDIQPVLTKLFAKLPA